MKKALEAGIEYCDKEVEKTLSNDTAFLCNRIVKNTLCEMLAAFDDEPEKPEPQESVVDWDALYKVIDLPGVSIDYSNTILCALQDKKDQWLKTKPADILLSQKYIENFKYCGLDSKQLYAAILYAKCHGFQCDDTKPLIDPEIKRVYEKLRHISILFSDEQWLKNDDGTISPIRQSIFDMWQAIKAHVERGG